MTFSLLFRAETNQYALSTLVSNVAFVRNVHLNIEHEALHIILSHWGESIKPVKIWQASIYDRIVR
jgi:hypothetical protein